jgi:hypothetical protein
MAIRIRRRELIATLGSAAVAWPLAVRAQQSKARRIGALILGNADAPSFGTELRDGLRKNGYVEGQNIEFVFRSAETTSPCCPSSRLIWSRSKSISSWRSSRRARKSRKAHQLVLKALNQAGYSAPERFNEAAELRPRKTSHSSSEESPWRSLLQ